LWAQVQHLREAVGKVEGRTVVDVHLAFPIRGRDHTLEADALLDVRDAELLQLPQGHATVPRAFLAPVHVRMLMRHRQQHVKRLWPGGDIVASVRTGFAT
jgi:hypothetical protein